MYTDRFGGNSTIGAQAMGVAYLHIGVGMVWFEMKIEPVQTELFAKFKIIESNCFSSISNFSVIVRFFLFGSVQFNNLFQLFCFFSTPTYNAVESYIVISTP